MHTVDEHDTLTAQQLLGHYFFCQYPNCNYGNWLSVSVWQHSDNIIVMIDYLFRSNFKPFGGNGRYDSF